MGQQQLLNKEGNRMDQLPETVLSAQEEANAAADAHHAAWEELEAIAVPSHEDVDKWLAVRKEFRARRRGSRDYCGKRLIDKEIATPKPVALIFR